MTIFFQVGYVISVVNYPVAFISWKSKGILSAHWHKWDWKSMIKSHTCVSGLKKIMYSTGYLILSTTVETHHVHNSRIHLNESSHSARKCSLSFQVASALDLNCICSQWNHERVYVWAKVEMREGSVTSLLLFVNVKVEAILAIYDRDTKIRDVVKRTGKSDHEVKTRQGDFFFQCTNEGEIRQGQLFKCNDSYRFKDIQVLWQFFYFIKSYSTFVVDHRRFQSDQTMILSYFKLSKSKTECLFWIVGKSLSKLTFQESIVIIKKLLLLNQHLFINNWQTITFTLQQCF